MAKGWSRWSRQREVFFLFLWAELPMRRNVYHTHKLKTQHMLPVCHWPSQVCPLAAGWRSCGRSERKRSPKAAEGEKTEVGKVEEWKRKKKEDSRNEGDRHQSRAARCLHWCFRHAHTHTHTCTGVCVVVCPHSWSFSVVLLAVCGI